MASKLKQDGETLAFPNNGRGVFIYTKKISKGSAVEIYLTLDKVTKGTNPSDNYMRFRIDGQGVQFNVHANGSQQSVFIEQGLAVGSSGLEEEETASYWISVDLDSLLIKYGKGYLMKETTFQIIDFNNNNNQTARKAVVNTFFSPALPLYLMVFVQAGCIQYPNPMIDAETAFQFRMHPLAGNLPPLVKDSSTVTLFDLDRGEFIFSDDLPTACLEMYNILKGCELEYPDNPAIKLSDAMRYSINTEGKYLNNIIKSKIREYHMEGPPEICVTLGPDMRAGPGIPFVLVIWPSGCKSPIHNHGGACAIIKVLFGQIQISIYNKEMNPVCPMKPLLKFEAKQGNFTWMDENWYQTHELKNTTDDFCATIQSYRYRNEDIMQWSRFDYVKENYGSSQRIVYPGNDTTFVAMRKAVLEEYPYYVNGGK